MVNVFVYGTLLAEEIVRVLIKRVPSSCKAVLPNYHRSSVRNRVYPAATFKQNHKIEGKVLLDLTPKELEIMDDFEGDEYKRITVEPLLMHGNTPLEAFVYVWANPQDKDLFGVWSYEDWRSSDLERYQAMCEEYIDTGINVT